MYPHNFNLVYRWSPRTSALMRDWLLLQIRRGVASDDQKTLHFAEMRQLRAGGLHVGQVSTPYAAAFYNALRITTADGAVSNMRITRVIHGPVHVLHSRTPTDCAAFNAHSDSPRQILFVGHKPSGAKRSNITLRTLFSLDECERALAGGGGVARGGVWDNASAAEAAEAADVANAISDGGSGRFGGGGSGNSDNDRSDSTNSTPLDRRPREQCRYRDVGPRITPAHARLRMERARARNASREELAKIEAGVREPAWINSTRLFVGLDALGRAIARPRAVGECSFECLHRAKGLCTNMKIMPPSCVPWPPIRRSSMEPHNLTHYFGKVLIE